MPATPRIERLRWMNPLSTLYRIFVVAILVFLIAPVFIVVVNSFQPTNQYIFPPTGISLVWYKVLLAHLNLWPINDPQFTPLFPGGIRIKPGLPDAISLSLWLASLVTSFSTVTGILSAYVIVRFRFRGKRILDSFLNLPLTFPWVVVGVSLLLLFSDLRTPIPLRLLLGHTVVTFPYVTRTVASSLYNYRKSIEEAALNLGATPVKVFLKITLPLIKPGIIAGAILAFLTSFSLTFTISFFLFTGDYKPLPVWVFEILNQGSEHTISALGTLLIIGTFVALLITNKRLGVRLLAI